MNFNAHSDLIGVHAFLGASRHAWVNYDENTIRESYNKFLAVQRGTDLHSFANHCILLRQRLPNNKKTLNTYVNDAIGFRMKPEQPLFYSENSFGTADAISFRENFLRIHDLKTGVTPVSMRQLEIYMALFCLEYSKDPRKIESELRIYQSNEVIYHTPDNDTIIVIMDKIVKFDKMIARIKIEMEE